ncbi:hypothetical protein KK083_03975 [Fulvivirgaceae bacterium PWU4]|uniref:DUF4468 domain-containing protein n=1 Tax=Chryseosolibacter histidini TaxID=2782349 RepID=A0AAP2GHH1_9BACT|nr:hypothetical protein [Chryseosolibacter histidini]MBT1696021.1 hypothetical protein [Chryseosolibacter histidini]
MPKVAALILLLALACCTAREQTSQPAHPKRDTAMISPNPDDFYSVLKIYGDSESDSLLLPVATKKRIKVIRMQGTEMAQQPYGGGDCWGKVRRFVLAGDTLTIDKHSCGEHGFGNTVFLKTGDSLRMVVTYEVDHQQNENQSLFTDLLEIVEFKPYESNIQTSTEFITDWSVLTTDRAPRKSGRFQGENASANYEYHIEQCKALKKLNVLSDE